MQHTESSCHSAVWITWEKQVRNRSLSARLGARLHEILGSGGRLRRYAICISRTLPILFESRHQLVFVQNPSIVLSFIAVLLKPLLRYKLYIDAHNVAISPESPSKFLTWIGSFIHSAADHVIVTNSGLAEKVRQIGGRPVILPDPLPSMPQDILPESRGGRQVMFICSWAADEPYNEVFEAAALLPEVSFFVTGASRGREQSFGRPLPGNVHLTGYLPDDRYHELMATSSIVIDLTTREDCLVCGAYEAVAMTTPFILSDSRALREYFSSGGVHVENKAHAIARGVDLILSDYERFKADVAVFKVAVEEKWKVLAATAIPDLNAIG